MQISFLYTLDYVYSQLWTGKQIKTTAMLKTDV